MKKFLCMRMCVCALQFFKVIQYLSHFKSEFDAIKNKIGELLEKINLASPNQCMSPL